MASYYNPSKRLSEWAAAALSPFIQLETEDGQTDQSRLSVALWSGNVQLNNVELRPEAFDKLLNTHETGYNEFGTKIRWKIVRGTISNVSVSIPWKSLLVGTSYTSLMRRKQKEVAEVKNDVNESVMRQGSDVADMSTADQDCIEKDPATPDDDTKDLAGCARINIDGLCLIFGYEVVHQDSSLDVPNNQSPSVGTLSEEQYKRPSKEERNRILQNAERRLLAGLDPFPPALTESLQKDIQSILQSSLEQTISDLPTNLSKENIESASKPSTYRSKVENYFSSTIKSLLWRTYDSLSVSVNHIRISVIGSSHYDKQIRVLSMDKRARKRPMQRHDAKRDSSKRYSHSVFEDQRKISIPKFSPRFISTDLLDHNWEPYPSTITPVRRHHASNAKRSAGSILEEHIDEDRSDYYSKGTEKVEADIEEEITARSREGYVEFGFVIDKIDMRPGSVTLLQSNNESKYKERDEKNPESMSMKYLYFRRIGMFVRRGTSSLLTANKIEPKSRKDKKQKELPWHEIEYDDFIVLPTNIETQCTFYRQSFDGDTTVTSTHTTKDRVVNCQRVVKQTVDMSHDHIETSDQSHTTSGTKRRAKRDKKNQPKLAELSSSGSKNIIQTIESNFNESHLTPKHLELNWTIGHIRSNVSSRHFYLMDSSLKSLSRLKRGRPSISIRFAKSHDREMIRQSVITPKDSHLYNVLPKLRSTNHRTILILSRVARSWWRYVIMSVILEVNQRRRLIKKCSNTSEKNHSTNSTKIVQKLRWDWNEQSRIRKEYIELYFTVHGTPLNTLSDQKINQNQAFTLSATTRLEALENGLSIERILLLRSISRAALVSTTNAVGNETSSYYNLSPKCAQYDSTIRAIENDSSLSVMKHDTIPQLDIQLLRSYPATTQNKKTNIPIDKTYDKRLMICFSATITGFSLALCELHDAIKEIDEKNTREDLSDDISALTGFSDSVDSSSYNPHSEQQTVYERFDTSYRFWEHKKHKLRYVPISLLHILDVNVSVQHSCLKRKYKLLVGGVAIQKDSFSSSNIFSIGHIAGLEKSSHDQLYMDSPFSVPCISVLTVFDHILPVSSICNIKASSIDIDWEWVQRVSTFFCMNKEESVRNNLRRLYKEQALKKVVFDTISTSRMLMSLECEKISANLPLNNTDSVALTLNSLQICLGTRKESKQPIEKPYVIDKNEIRNKEEPELLIVVDGLQATPQIRQLSNCQGVFQIPLTFEVYSNGIIGFQPIFVDLSQVDLLVSESTITPMLELMKIYSQIFNYDIYEEEECLRPQLPAIAEYALLEVQLNIESIGLHISSDVGYEDSTVRRRDLSPQQCLREITSNYISLMSCLDFEYPNKNAIDCMTKIYKDKCMAALDLSQQDASHCAETATVNYQSQLKAALGEAGIDIKKMRPSSKTTFLSSLLDQVVSRAVETTMLALSLNTRLAEIGLFVSTKSASISISTFYGKSLAQVKARSFTIHDGSGVNLLHIPEEQSCSMGINLSLSTFKAWPSETLHEFFFEVDNIHATFHPKSYSDAVTICRSLVDMVCPDDDAKNSSKLSKSHKTNHMIGFSGSGTVADVSIIFMDDIIPFVRLHFSDMSLNHSLSESGDSSHTTLLASEVSLQCVSPPGADTYPDVVTTHQFTNNRDGKEHNALAVNIKITSDDDDDVTICLDGVKIFVLRQFVNELLQYISSPDYGLGQLMNFEDLHGQTNETSLKTRQLTLKTINSTIILPRDSNSIDLVGIEADELTLSHLRVSTPWNLENYSFNDPLKDTAFNLESARSSLSETFFDCVDDISIAVTTSEHEINRTMMHLRGARLFTALNRHRHSPDSVDLPLWNRSVRCIGRCEKDRPVYEPVMNTTNPIPTETRGRVWKEITLEPLSLIVTADSTPTLRLLIEIVETDSVFDMRMSQLYLMMSVWYSNMQQLPVLFPYDMEFVDEFSMSPNIPSDWPEYGSDNFVERLKNCVTCDNVLEIALCIRNLRLSCSYDPPGYFTLDPETQSMLRSDTITVSLEDVMCNIVYDKSNLLRAGLTATDVCILDERAKGLCEHSVSVKNVNNSSPFVDLNWGLDCSRKTLIDGLSLPFQMTVFMTPDNNCMINLGADMLEGTLEDLSQVWILLDYFGLYFKYEAYGYPYFLANEIVQKALDSPRIEHDTLDIDFRLWLTRPHLIIPSRSEIHCGACIMIDGESGGFHYRYKSYGASHSSQDIVVKDMGIVALRECASSTLSRGWRQVSGSLQSSGAQTLIDGLSFSMQYDFNEIANYTKISLCIPLSFDRVRITGIETHAYDVEPYKCQPPLVCKPFFLPSRNMGSKCTAYFSMEYMKLAVEVLTEFVGPKQSDNISDKDISPPPNLYSITANVSGFELIISDPVMGMHRPILSISLPSLLVTASQLQAIDKKAMGRMSSTFNGKSGDFDCDSDLQASLELSAFVDYFKLGKTRNWEPLIEPFKCLILYENSQQRGQGVTVNLDCPLHLNITSAAVDTFDDAKDTFEQFWSNDSNANYTRRTVTDSDTMECPISNILHSRAEQIDELERRAFTLKNNTGQQIRVHMIASGEKNVSPYNVKTIQYLEHHHTMPLSFTATMTEIINLEPVEIAVEDRIQTVPGQGRNDTTHHHLDIQIPGFQWLHRVSIEYTGRKFIALIPRSISIQSKLDSDWRLKNSVQVLACVQSLNGGRRLSLHSPFEIINKTDHAIYLSISPDPRYNPELDSSVRISDGLSAQSEVMPDELFIVPHLLAEKALRIKGSHLGSVWIKPKPCKNLLQPKPLGNDMVEEKKCIAYPPRPIQLAKIVHETSVIWSDAKADPDVANQVASGTEISCPVLDARNNPQTTLFSYVLEVKRSPLAPQKVENVDRTQRKEIFSPSNITKGMKSTKIKANNTDDGSMRHQPVHYSLLVHPPIVIENLLPARGRFELMHATTKIVLWWGVLDPGQKVPVHTVGLDAPMVLLVNLGFCRTPLGEGALVHNGRNIDGLFKAGWNSLGYAMKTSKDKMKKTLLTVTESKDNRGLGRVSAVQARMNKSKDKAITHKTGQLGFSIENETRDNGMWYGDVIDADVIDAEIIVVDSIGQRLTLHIDNVIGGGGQRVISLFCPYWILNTTHHSLRYKQEKVSGFVSGTVISSELDGSKRVDGSNRNEENRDDGDLICQAYDKGPYSTIFSGRPGALHRPDDKPLEPEVTASLISEDLPLSIMSNLAFMFNFQETISLGTPPKLSVQLCDTSGKSNYTSAWSSGFGLESVGVTQIVGMHCKDGRRLEVSICVAIAPGRLSNYTKVVRICPRYVIVNQLPRPIRIWQDNSVLHPNQPVERSMKINESEKWIFAPERSNKLVTFNRYNALFGEKTTIGSDADLLTDSTANKDAHYIATVYPSELVAFHLPDTRIDRLLRIEYGSAWNLSSSIPVDVTGEYYITLTRAVDLRLLPHVSTRAAPIYTVTIPSPGKEWDGELGAWLETDYGREIIVKGVKEGSFASYWTDITVGDELISIDNIRVEEFTFEQAMKFMKARLASIKDVTSESNQMNRTFQRKPFRGDNQANEPTDQVKLTFMTLEERIRSLRRKAVVGHVESNSPVCKRDISSQNEQAEIDTNQAKHLVADAKFYFQSIFLFVREPNTLDPPHIIRNRSRKWAIFYRQRNCPGHQWSCLYPGESAAYTWQELTKPKKLSIRVGKSEWMFNSKTADRRNKKKGPVFSFEFIQDEEQGYFGATKTVKLDQIGQINSLLCPENGSQDQPEKVFCTVNTEGITRALIIIDEMRDDEALIKQNISNIRNEIISEHQRRTQLDVIYNVLASGNLSAVGSDLGCRITQDLHSIESKLQEMTDFGEGQYIHKRHQVLIQVLEATGLVSSDLNGLSNPYVKVSLKHQNSTFQRNSRCTYFVEKSLSPTWLRQIFVFDIPAKAADDPKETRNLSLQCTVKSLEKLGQDRFLGQVKIQLRDLINQKESIGWYPLMGVLGQRDIDSVDRIRGSLKIRVQYIRDYQGLVAYYQLCADRRIETLKKAKTGMNRQLRVLREASKQEAESKESILLTRLPALTTIGKRNKRLLELGDSEKLTHSAKIIRGVRDGSEYTLQKSIDLAKTVVIRGKKRDFISKSNQSEHEDITSEHFISNDAYFDEDHDEEQGNIHHKVDEVDKNSIDSTYDSFEEDTRIAHHPIASRQVDFRSKGICRSRISSLRERCKDHPLAIGSLNSSFLSWNTSRAFARSLNILNTSTLSLNHSNENNHLKFASSNLLLPHSVPMIIKDKENNYLDALMKARHLFSKKARRSLSSVVNPGGVLTIRPITALNLSNDFTGMFIKLRYGNTILISETVDCRVAPVWTDENNVLGADQSAPINSKRQRRRSLLLRKKKSDTGPSEFADLAEIMNPLARWGRPRKNDLQVEVAPFETSKSLRLSVIGERMQANVELGILDIELGPALECCTQSLEEFDEDRVSEFPQGLPPAYVRWFPLTSPADANPVEGDMGQSIKPKESEKLRDDMFNEYFAPCIQLALMFKPHLDDTDRENPQISPIGTRLSTDQYFYVKLDRLSAALIDSNRINIGELLSFTSRDADLRVSKTKAKTRVSFSVGTVQLDQQRMSQDSKAPVILAPSLCKHPQPLVQFLAWKDNLRSNQDLDSFEYVALEVQDLELKLEESWLFDLWTFYVAIAKSRENKQRMKQPPPQVPCQFSAGDKVEISRSLKMARDFLHGQGAISSTKKVYIRELILGYMKISLWYYKRYAWSSGIEDERINSARYELFLSPSILSQRMPDKNSSDEAFKNWSELTEFTDIDGILSPSTINIVSAIIPSISDASVSFQGKLIEHVFETQGDVWKSLRRHYSSEALKQIYKIIGSLDFVGNPSMLLTSFRKGLRDFIMQPSRELKYITRNPSRLGVGVIKGTVSLFSNSTSGLFGFFSNLGSTAGQTATLFTFDEHFQRHHLEKQTAQQRHYNRWRRKGCGHATLIITRPLHDIVFGVLSASTGLLTEPYRGAKRYGVIGFGKGVGVGILGLIVKPIVGFCDAFAHIMGSFDDIAKSVNLLEIKLKPIERYRLPYTFGLNRMLMPFDQVQSKSAQLLLEYPFDKKVRRYDEVIVTAQALHMGPGWNHYIVVTTKRVVFFKLRDLDDTGFITANVIWQVRYEEGFRISSSLSKNGHNGTVLYISKYSSAFERNADEISLSSSEDVYDAFQNESKYGRDLTSDMERSQSFPITPKAFRLRNTRLFASSNIEQAQRFEIEGSFEQRKQLLQIHNAICCLCGDTSSIVHENLCITRDEGITRFGNLFFDFHDSTTESSTEDPALSLSILENAPWKYLQDAHIWPSDAFQQAVSTPSPHPIDVNQFTSIEQELEVTTMESIGISGNEKHFNFAECYADESEESADIEPPIVRPSLVDDHTFSRSQKQSYEGKFSLKMAPLFKTDHNEEDSDVPLDYESTQRISNMRSNEDETLDIRLRRVEELLEQVARRTSRNTLYVDPEPSYYIETFGEAGENLPSIKETQEEGGNITRNNDDIEVDALQYEISELKQQLTEQSKADNHLQTQIETHKKTKNRIMKIFHS